MPRKQYKPAKIILRALLQTMSPVVVRPDCAVLVLPRQEAKALAHNQVIKV